MTNPLHHTIRDTSASQLLLARQWAERINYEAETLKESKSDEYDLWRNRLTDDIKTAIDRAKEDGFSYLLHVGIGTMFLDYPNKDLRIIPYLTDLYVCGKLDKLAVFVREAVQP